ncbi:MFS transporter [Candidatus Babeliales bacterium]|nr:MFS transporter [Candidatus Babeliales bacterium]
MKRKKYFGIDINVIFLSLVSCLNDMSSEMIMPILPLFIQSLGGGGIVIGLIGGLRESIAGILKIISGYWSDKIGKRKIFVFSGYFCSASFKLLLALSKTWQHVLISSSLERIGKGLRDAPRDAIIADYATINRGKVFGFHRTFDTTGAILGSVIVLILFWVFKFSFSSIIFIAVIIGFVSLFPLEFVSEKQHDRRRVAFKIRFTNLPRKLKKFIIIAGFFALANFSYMFFILKAQQIISGKASVEMSILLYVIFNFFYALFAIPLGMLSDKIGRRKVIVFGYFVFSLTCFGMVVFNSLFSLIFIFILYGLTKALIEGNQKAYVSDISAQYIRATALGAFHTVTSILALFSSLIAGFLWQFSPNATFIYGSTVALIPVILFFVFKTKIISKKHTKSQLLSLKL